MSANEPKPDAGVLIVRPAGEVATKSRQTRDRFEQVLRSNILDALASVGASARIKRTFGRMTVTTDAPELAAAALGRVFGIGTLSSVEGRCAANADAIVAAGTRLFAERVRGRRYAVRARRVNSEGVSGADINRRLGAALNPGATVDLTDPEVVVHAEIGESRCEFFSDRTRGACGLPLGASGRAVALMSGGFDSPVAAWRLMRRGVAVDFVFCNLGGGAYERMVIQVAKVLADAWSYGHKPRLYVIDFTEPVAELQRVARPQYWQVVLKRLMYRAATAVAEQTGGEAIITGEAIGQVSSQTLANLRANEGSTPLPLLRPLIGWEKTEIIAEAKLIGTAALSRRVKEYCAIAPGHPVVATTEERVDVEDAKLDPAVLARAIAALRVHDLRALKVSELSAAYVFKDTIPANAVLLDCQPEPMFLAWHVPGAVHRDPLAILDDYRSLDKNRTYVVYCTHGMQSAGVAEVLQQSGFEAYAFDGGIAALKRYIDARGPAG